VSQKIYMPFTAIVGMEKAKRALLAVAVDPSISGVLLVGDRGTGKTVLVRSLAQVLPPIPVVKGCPYNCNPFNPHEMCPKHYEMWKTGGKLAVEYKPMRVVDLPLNVTPDRLVGTIDVEASMRAKQLVFRPGILAEANRNILYVDEVNLLDDYIVDLLLDAAATGWNIVEREGFSVKHPARFILVGSMNPEEGELRPQLLDRFGLYVNVEASLDPETRMEIVRRVEEFNADPEGFHKKWETEERRLREKIALARDLVGRVQLPEDLLKLIAETTVKLKVRTHRADIIIARTAKALAALDGLTKVELKHVKEAMELALPHRIPRQRDAIEAFRRILRELDERYYHHNHHHNTNGAAKQESVKGESGKEATRKTGTISLEGEKGGLEPTGKGPRLADVNVKEEHNFGSRALKIDVANYSGTFSLWQARRRLYVRRVGGKWGIPLYSIPAINAQLYDIDIVSSFLTAMARGRNWPTMEDLRVRVRRQRRPLLELLLVDVSASMSSREKLEKVKSVLQKLVAQCYIDRAKLAVIVFQGKDARLLQPPTRAPPTSLPRELENIRFGGATPLPAALYKALQLIEAYRKKNPTASIELHLVTDCKTNVPLWGRSAKEDVVDLVKKLKHEKVVINLYPIKSLDRSLTLSRDYCALIEELINSKIV